MKFSQEINSHINQIRAYQDGEVTVQTLHEAPGEAPQLRSLALKHSFIITRDSLHTDWPPQNLEELRAEHFQSILAEQPEVLLLGLKAPLRQPSLEVLRTLIEQRIGYEVMEMGAACRTYNILAGDGRRVAAAILLG